MRWPTAWTASPTSCPAVRPSSSTAWVEMMFDLAYDPQLRMHLTVIDSDEVRAAKGYRETRERLHAERERSLERILAARPRRRVVSADRSAARRRRHQRGGQP